MDENLNVNMGTAQQPVLLNVLGAVVSRGAGGGALQTRNPNNDNASFSLGWLNDVARLRLGGSGPGAGDGLDIQSLGNRSLMRITGAGDVGIGTASPEVKLHVVERDRGSAIIGTTTDQYAIFGQTTASVGFGAGVWGASSGSSCAGLYGFASGSSNGYGVYAWASATSGRTYGVYSRSDSSSGYDFYAAGAGVNYGSGSSRRRKNNIENIDQPWTR